MRMFHRRTTSRRTQKRGKMVFSEMEKHCYYFPCDNINAIKIKFFLTRVAFSFCVFFLAFFFVAIRFFVIVYYYCYYYYHSSLSHSVFSTIFSVEIALLFFGMRLQKKKGSMNEYTVIFVICADYTLSCNRLGISSICHLFISKCGTFLSYLN